MRFHVLITYSDTERPQTEMLIEGNDYSDVSQKAESTFNGEVESLRMRILDPRPDMPAEVYIKRGSKK
jgi:hypothetical protein